MPEVTKSPFAEGDLVAIWQDIAQDNIDAADGLLRLIDKTCRMLADFPRLGRARDHLAPGIFSFPVGSYLIFYREASSGIEVARVLHGARDLPQIFSSV